MSDDVVLSIANVSKSFGAIHALRGVDFELRRGEVHAIAGENGAGKSTLMNIIDGILRPDAGDIFLNGEAVEITSPARAQELGIGFVHQEIALCPDVSVAENIFMAEINASRKWFMDYRALHERARAALAPLSPIDPAVLVGTLSISSQQVVEIAKALTLDCRILILDEPTAALTDPEAQVLFGIMRKLAARGISIIYISHRMAEIFENCDRVSVFRDGRRIVTADVADITPDFVVNNMVGRAIGTLYPPKQPPGERKPGALLEVHGLSDGRRFRDVELHPRPRRNPRHRRPDRRRPQRDRQGHLRPAPRCARRGGARRRAFPDPLLPRQHRPGRRLPFRGPQGRRGLHRPLDRCQRLGARSRAGFDPLGHHRCREGGRAGEPPRRPARSQARQHPGSGVLALRRKPAEGGDRQDAFGAPAGDLPRRTDARRRRRRQVRDPPHSARPWRRRGWGSSSSPPSSPS